MASRLKLGGDVPQRRRAPVDRIARQLLFASCDHRHSPSVQGSFRSWGVSGNWTGRTNSPGGNTMLKTIALIGVGTAIAFMPLPTIAQTAPAASATAPGSHSSQM